MAILDKTFKFGDSEVLCREKEPEKAIVDIARSQIASGPIVSYGKDQFLFKTTGVIMPRFLTHSIGETRTIIGTDLHSESMTEGKLSRVIQKTIASNASEERNGAVREIVRADRLIRSIYDMGKHQSAIVLERFFNRVATNTEVRIKTYSGPDKSVYFTIYTKPILNLKEVMSEYFHVIYRRNKLYRSNVESEDMCFTPMDDAIGGQLVEIVKTMLLACKTVRELLVSDLITYCEEEWNIEIDEYSHEENSLSGVKKDGDATTYFRNIIRPSGMSALVTDTDTKEKHLCALAKEIEFMPQQLSVTENKDLFVDTIRLTEIKFPV